MKPTARTSVVEKAFTDRSRVVLDPGSGTPATFDHAIPFQWKTIGMSLPGVELRNSPTAHASDADTRDTAFRRYAPVPGLPGTATRLHALPFQWMIIGVKLGPVPVFPTAHRSLALPPTPVRSLPVPAPVLPLGVATRDSVDPFQRSARVLDWLPPNVEPTSHASLSATKCTSCRPSRVPGDGMVRRVHAVPSQCSASDREFANVEGTSFPTASTFESVRAETPVSCVNVAPMKGESTNVHAGPHGTVLTDGFARGAPVAGALPVQ